MRTGCTFNVGGHTAWPAGPAGDATTSRRSALGACLSLTALPLLPLLLPIAANSAGPGAGVGAAAPLLTMLDGAAYLLRGSDKLALAEGVLLQPDDILDVPADAPLARLEFTDGLSLALGPGSRVLMAPRLTGDRAGACIYLLAGWAKLSAPGAPQAVKASLLAPAFDVAVNGGTVVMAVQAAATMLFVEAGGAVLRRNGAAPQSLKAGELLSLAHTAGAKPEVTNRPTPAFVASLPRAFMDALPARAAKFRDRPVTPRRLGALVYVDAQPWLDAEPALRRVNLPRWRALARDPDFRRGLMAGLKSHPEWAPILMPPIEPQATRPQANQPPAPSAQTPRPSATHPYSEK